MLKTATRRARPVKPGPAYSLVFALLMLPPGVSALAAQTMPPTRTQSPIGERLKGEQLRFVVVISRHGVRSPTGKLDELNRYSAQPWPAWAVPPGYLTEHGAKLMTLFGSYDRELFAREGLLAASGCEDAAHVKIVADSDQRTRETGKALAAGLMPACPVDVHALPEGTPDPLFHSLEAGVGHPDKQLAAAAVSGRIGNSPLGLTDAYRPQLLALENVLSGNMADTAAIPGDPPPKASLLDVPISLAPGKGDHLVEFRGPLATASTLAENLLLEYTEGMAHPGWGRLDAVRLRELMQLHTASSDLGGRTRYIARVQASNMLAHVLDSMQQAVTQKPVIGALTSPSDRMLILVGHDTNLANIAGALDLSWLIDGRRDDTPPGGALVFELWQQGTDYSIRTYYMAQTIDQMRDAAPLSLAAPPDRAVVFVPGCSGDDAACGWTAFHSALEDAIDAEFVR